MHGSDIILLAWDDEPVTPPDDGDGEALIDDSGSALKITPGGDLTVTNSGSYLALDDPTSELPNITDAGDHLTITN